MKQSILVCTMILIVVITVEHFVLLHEITVFSPPDGLVAGSQQAQAHHKSFSSSPSEVASDKSATFTFDDLPDVLDAIEWEESKGDPNAKGDYVIIACPDKIDGCLVVHGVYRAIGAYQLWKIYVDDCNRIMHLYIDAWQPAIDAGKIGKAVPVVLYGEDIYQFTYDDRWDRDKSRAMTEIVTYHYANHDWKGKEHTRLQWLETAARTHKNPTERNMDSTKAYWLRVKARMEKVRIVE